MEYSKWVDSIVNQIEDYKANKVTDLVLLRNHLTMLIDDIERTVEFRLQLDECEN